MSLSAGFVGLPNVGKSTLFNALTLSQVPAANYPFCTIEPHKAIAPVPDDRLETLKSIYNSGAIIPAVLECFDIAGLVKGAAQGQGLGNKFLGNIQAVDLIVHVVRCFEDSSITSEEPTIDPIRDFETIVTELMLKDLETIEKRLQKLETIYKNSKNNAAMLEEKNREEKSLAQLKNVLEHATIDAVQQLLSGDEYSKKISQVLGLLSCKPFIVVANIEEDFAVDPYSHPWVIRLTEKFGSSAVIPLSARLEHDIAKSDEVSKQELMDMLGMKQSQLPILIRQAYMMLGYITFFTCGPQEIHAWQIVNGTTIRQAAGSIHSDLERGFICAEVCNYASLVQAGGMAQARNKGLIRTEGESYIVVDGDIIHVRFNVS